MKRFSTLRQESCSRRPTLAENTTSLANLTPSETVVVRQLEWFSLPSIVRSAERIYPVLLPDYLPDVIAGQYPQSPIVIDLAGQPRSQ